jgi:predicted DNA-binding transcriptional regulator YafY
VLLLAGCAGLRTPIQPEGEAEERQVLQLIVYAQRVATMTAEQLRREYSASSQAFARDKDTSSRMRLALLLATPGTGVQDATRAANLLEPMATPADAPGPLRAFARLLYVQLNERTSEQKRAGQMREKLDALKEVERTIMERGQESQPRRR